MPANRQGLSRTIPADVKQIVRKDCGFGCVMCGAIPYDYDHLEVEFNAADTHDPADIVLLCPTHHRMKGNQLSVETIKKARKSRMGVNSVFRFKLPATHQEFEVNWAGNIISAADNSVVVDNEPILNFVRTDNDLEPILISGQFRDRYGRIICDVVDNEFIGHANQLGDFKLEANRFHYSLPDGLMGLAFQLTEQRMNISYAFHVKDDAHVFAQGDLLQVGNLYGAVRLRRNRFIRSTTAIVVGSACDNFQYDHIDISKIPASEISDSSMVNCQTGVHFGGRNRYRPTSNYHRLDFKNSSI